MRKNDYIFRNASVDDVEALCQLELQVWGEEMSAREDIWESRLKIFPEGVCMAEIDNEVVGVVVTHYVKWDYAEGEYPTWALITANGYLTNHCDDGDVFYGVDMSVLPSNFGVADRLLQFVFDLMRQRGVNRGYLGSRIPTLKKRSKKECVEVIDEDYVLQAAKYDPTVNFFKRNGLWIVGAKRDYFPEDIESLGWGVILEGL